MRLEVTVSAEGSLDVTDATALGVQLDRFEVIDVVFGASACLDQAL